MLECLQEELQAYLDARPTMREHNQNPLVASIGLVKESAECLEAEQLGMREVLASEAADVLIWLLVLAGNYGFNLVDSAILKLQLNAERFPPGAFQDPSVPFEKAYLQIKLANGERRAR